MIEEKPDKNLRGLAAPEILLVILPPWGVDTPPLGPACLSTYLRKKGFATQVFDANIYCYNYVEDELKYLWEMANALYWREQEAYAKVLYPGLKGALDYCVDKIIASGAAVVGFSVLSVSQNLITGEIIKEIKARKPGVKIIVGGISVSVDEQRVFFEKELKGLVDIYVIGEGEGVLGDILEAYRGKKPVKDIPGTLIPEFGQSLPTPRLLQEDLSDFGYPLFEEFDLNAYANKNSGLIMEWSRGCVGNCLFCSFKVISGRFRRKGIAPIIQELSYYKQKFGVNHFSLVDSAVNSDMEHLAGICEAIFAARLDLRFSALAIPRKGMDLLMIDRMKRAGFQRIEYGVESGSNKVLKAMNKIFTAQDAQAAIRITHNAKIMTVIYLIVGFPGEDECDFNQTLEFLKRNAGYIDLVKSANPLMLMAGSHIYKHRSQYGISFPERNPDFMWQIDGQNNYEIRLERVHKVRRILEEYGIKYFSEDNQYERKIEIK